MLLCSLLPVLPAIYLAKKNIRKQGALVDHEKVGPPPQAESSQRSPSPTHVPRASQFDSEHTDQACLTLQWLSREGGGSMPHP